MFIADYHVHSLYSSDSEALLEDNIEQAVSLGLKEIAITDHIDLDYPRTGSPDAVDFIFDLDQYFKHLKIISKKFEKKIRIVRGIELGLQPQVAVQNMELIKAYDLDFVIASTHVIDYQDPFYGEYFNGKSEKRAYEIYFEDILNNIKLVNGFNVYGHIDYITRYTPNGTKKILFSEFEDYYVSIFKALIEKGCGIELNTSGFRYGLNQTHPQFEALKKYRELGGEIITVGSDAHKYSDICAYFDKAYTLLREAGFTKITLFANREPIWVDL